MKPPQRQKNGHTRLNAAGMRPGAPKEKATRGGLKSKFSARAGVRGTGEKPYDFAEEGHEKFHFNFWLK